MASWSSDYLTCLDMKDLIPIASQFVHRGKVSEIHAFGNGNINDTFLVSLDDANSTRFVLQRLNHQVFPRPELVMQNLRTFSEHVQTRWQNTPLKRRWQFPELILTKEAQTHWQATDGSFWRAISFIDRSKSLETLENQEQGREVGYALGMFHNCIGDLSPAGLADTLEGFHITPLYLERYRRVLAKTAVVEAPEVTYCLQFVENRSSWCHVLENAKAEGKLPLRSIHGDPKVNNVLFDLDTGKAVSLIDLDTVKPGLVHYDIGDCLRSGCNPLGEETEEWEEVYFEPELCKSILQGYLGVARELLTKNDCDYLYDGIRLIAFELGLRFFSDYLAGNVYFKVKYPEQNLARALVQFKLTESIEAQANSIRQLIEDLS